MILWHFGERFAWIVQLQDVPIFDWVIMLGLASMSVTVHNAIKLTGGC